MIARLFVTAYWTRPAPRYAQSGEVSMPSPTSRNGVPKSGKKLNAPPGIGECDVIECAMVIQKIEKALNGTPNAIAGRAESAIRPGLGAPLQSSPSPGSSWRVIVCSVS